jgi:hypothetical protein
MLYRVKRNPPHHPDLWLKSETRAAPGWGYYKSIATGAICLWHDSELEEGDLSEEPTPAS